MEKKMSNPKKIAFALMQKALAEGYARVTSPKICRAIKRIKFPEINIEDRGHDILILTPREE